MSNFKDGAEVVTTEDIKEQLTKKQAYQKMYRQSEAGKAAKKRGAAKYCRSDKGRATIRAWTAKHALTGNKYKTKTRPEYMAKWRERNPELDRANAAHYRETHKVVLRKRWQERDRRADYLRYHYSLSVESYEAMFKKQLGVCAICQHGSTDGKRLHVDHSHKTGTIRGLLCGHCNRGIGLLKDDPEIVSRAKEYLLLSLNQVPT